MGQGFSNAPIVSKVTFMQRHCLCMDLFIYVLTGLPVSLLFPWISMVMVAALLPETRAVALHKLQAIEPLGALIEVELGHQQAYRATMLDFQILPIVLESNHHIIIVKVGKW